jgi:sugar phosphate isomerase/epimerase
MIFVSTGGVRKKTAAETARDYLLHGIFGVELSGGSFSSSYENDLLGLPNEAVLQVHNYFPPPELPFVFNLASMDPLVARQSINQVRVAMQLAVKLNNPVYSFHAGFRINPIVSDLGSVLGRYNLAARHSALEQFGERVCMLAEEARREGVTLLIENNVLTKPNLSIYQEDPLLLTSPDEISDFMEKMPSNIGLLLDVAHLKVSAKTLNFGLHEAHVNLKKWIKGYHLSDNNGDADSNECITESSWFWDSILLDLSYYTLEVYGLSTPALASQVDLLHNKIKS